MKTKDIITHFLQQFAEKKRLYAVNEDFLPTNEGATIANHWYNEDEMVAFFVTLCKELAHTRKCQRPDAYEGVLKEHYSQYKSVAIKLEWPLMSWFDWAELMTKSLMVWGFPSRSKPKPPMGRCSGKDDWEWNHVYDVVIDQAVDIIKTADGREAIAMQMWAYYCMNALTSENSHLVRGKFRKLFQPPVMGEIFVKAMAKYEEGKK